MSVTGYFLIVGEVEDMDEDVLDLVPETVKSRFLGTAIRVKVQPLPDPKACGNECLFKGSSQELQAL